MLASRVPITSYTGCKQSVPPEALVLKQLLTFSLTGVSTSLSYLLYVVMHRRFAADQALVRHRMEVCAVLEQTVEDQA